MLDIDTLRFTLATMSTVVLILFYVGVYRPTRSAFAGWWSLALLCAAVCSALALVSESALQTVLNPAASIFSIVGGVSVWFATRSLRGLAPVVWVIYAAPAAATLLTLLMRPAPHAWSGNLLLNAVMAVFLTLAAREMWIAWAARRQACLDEHDGEVRVAFMVAALASSVLAGFIVWRVSLFVVAGPDSEIFLRAVGSGATTIVLLVTLISVTFSAAAMGYDQQTRELRRRVAIDDLTGLLARSAFFERTSLENAKPPSSGRMRVFVVADLDHFKAINDGYGHAAGDRALEVFSDSVLEMLGEDEFAGRLGGEEFAFLLCETSLDTAVDRLRELSARFATLGVEQGLTLPTASYGITTVPTGASTEECLARADAAMYRAKSAGRDGVMIDRSAFVAFGLDAEDAYLP